MKFDFSVVEKTTLGTILELQLTLIRARRAKACGRSPLLVSLRALPPRDWVGGGNEGLSAWLCILNVASKFWTQNTDWLKLNYLVTSPLTSSDTSLREMRWSEMPLRKL